MSYWYNSKYGYSYQESAKEIALPSGTQLYVGPCSADFPKDVYVISLTSNSYKEVHAPIEDFTLEPIERVQLALKIANRLVRAGNKIGFCCSGGCGRTGTVSIIYMIAYEELSAAEAYSLFYEARHCGPESNQQWMAIAIADLLRRKGYSGDRLVDMLIAPKTMIMMNNVTLDSEASKIVIDGVKISEYLDEYVEDLIIDAIKAGKKVVLPLSNDSLKLLEKAGIKIPQETQKEIEKVMEYKRLMDEIYLSIEKVKTVTTTTKNTKETRGKRNQKKTKKTKKEDSLSDYYDYYYRYDELEDYGAWWEFDRNIDD